MLSELWNSMSGEVRAAVGAMLISLIASGIAYWQARTARDQAVSARDAAAAAQAQVELLRRQVEGDEKARMEASGPQFELISAHTAHDPWSESYAEVTFRQSGGPALTSVRVATSGEGVGGLRRDLAYGTYIDGDFDYETIGDLEIGPMATGGTHTVRVSLDYGVNQAKVQLDFTCSASADQPTWRRALQASAAPIPVRPATGDQRRGRRS
ncbi:hypothetical protein [Streptomyces sp. NPDC085665]|uniref:hypothetical protein n=1 Tax=Streptomyces sp. NPDC085665 TaxID=3365735 RepID=UPI0037D70874